jgi:uncharacterized membrane protein
MLRITLAVLHLLALGIGVGSVYARARALHAVGTGAGGAPGALAAALRRALSADSWWGLAGFLWIVTGLWRALAGTEKASGYYWSNHVFYAKMGCLAVLLVLEIAAVVVLVGWRRAGIAALETRAASLAPTARRLARFSDAQLLLVGAMLVAAVLMARGYGARA